MDAIRRVVDAGAEGVGDGSDHKVPMRPSIASTLHDALTFSLGSKLRTDQYQVRLVVVWCVMHNNDTLHQLELSTFHLSLRLGFACLHSRY